VAAFAQEQALAMIMPNIATREISRAKVMVVFLVWIAWLYRQTQGRLFHARVPKGPHNNVNIVIGPANGLA